ncbi:hypothetical protein QTO34_009691 [Cnephaeus nilssonii]|uniref:Uncharacterized protein n=1 Tax=Cnephaeus nilssonii TaxID=3371016 RepID=A0AA40HI90_CNENI|nr:hypothetical protein QTO34_009691 [Eptesicus nilssonii]
MPKVFLVKQRSPGVSVRSWRELLDEERADPYIPAGPDCLLCDPAPHPRTAAVVAAAAPGDAEDPGRQAQAAHSCDLCGTGFRLQRRLHRPLKCHTQVKRRRCTFCGQGFKGPSDLKRQPARTQDLPLQM